MKTIFESKLPKGFVDLIEEEGRLYVSTAFRKGVQGVVLELPLVEAADLAEAILRQLGDDTARSVFESVVGKRHENNTQTHSESHEEIQSESSAV
jgi:hypothetical protein